MAAVETTKAFDVVALDEIEHGDEHQGRVRRNVRRHFDIRAFGVGATRAVSGDAQVVGEHDETGIGASGQEELYVVLSGSATFTVNGEEVPAAAGTLVFVRDPAARRGAVAHEEGTTVLAVGGTPGQAYRLSPGEVMQPMWESYNAGDFQTALERLQEVLAERPQEGLVLFNVACVESRLGRLDDALEHLSAALEVEPRLSENAANDEDLDPLRDDPRFKNIIKDS